MADIFGDDSLFAEFDKERDTQNIFINYEQDDSGTENRSRIIFRAPDSEPDDSDVDEEDESEAGNAVPVKSESENDAAAQNGHEASDADSNQQTIKSEATSSEPMDLDSQQIPQQTAYQEHFQKNKLRQFARLIDSTRVVPEESSPGVQVVFQNNKFAKKYRSRIEQFIMNLVEHADRKDFTKVAAEFSTRMSIPSCVDINDSLPAEKRTNRLLQLHEITGCSQFHSGFMVDSRGCPQDEEEPSESNQGEATPKYAQVFEEVYPPPETIPGPTKPQKPKQECFNCGDEHRLNDCKKPKDHNRIRQKRREHADNKASSQPTLKCRYHEDPELDPNKAQFRAGSISDSLREAMGLESNQLPSYIYRMRMYGYPPGWLMQANRKALSLAMYDSQGRETNMRGESLEDGEYGEQTANDPAEMFDVSKILEYPGFTVPVPNGCHDDHESIGMPSIQPHQLKKTLMDDVIAKEYHKKQKKRQLEEEEAENSKKLKTGNEDKDQEDETPSEPMDTKEGDEASVSEEDKAAAVAAADSTTTDIQPPATNGDDNTAESTSAAVEPGTSVSSMSEAESLREKNFSFTSSTSIAKDYGTPILGRRYRTVPTPDKFRVGAEEHIPFENLPDSAGNFDKLRNLFAMIKNKVTGKKK